MPSPKPGAGSGETVGLRSFVAARRRGAISPQWSGGSCLLRRGALISPRRGRASARRSGDTPCIDALKFALIAACALAPLEAGAQTANNLAALKGLAPFAALPNSPAGQAALAANFAVTGGVQTGALRRPSLLPFADQQQQALKDVFITGGDLAELADGLGTTLGAAYVARAHYLDRSRFTNVSQAVADVIAYALMTSAVDSNSAKYFFANATTDGKTPVSDQAAAILAEEHGVTDVFGVAYGRPRGGPAPTPMATRGRSRRSRNSPRSPDPTISTFLPTMSSTTAGRR